MINLVKLVTCLVLLGSLGKSSAQTCDFTIQGQILSQDENEPLYLATVYVQETEQGALSDSLGNFFLKNLCPGSYHLKIQHVGCETKEFFIALKGDTLLQVSMHHHAELLHGVTVRGERESSAAGQSSSVLDQDAIHSSTDQDLSTMLSRMPGLRNVQNGSNIGRPLVQGLGGNRLTILNNGASQAGQQWGTDHAPELDPSGASRIIVLRGTQGIAYGSNSLGSTILIEEAPIPKDPHLHGALSYGFKLNGLGHQGHLKLEQGLSTWAWRVNLGGVLSGTMYTPDYLLKNTSYRRASSSFRLEKKWSKQLDSFIFYSYYRSENGILRGALLDNLTDLESAIERPEPFFTDNEFTYAVEEPRQEVSHHLMRTRTRYHLNEGYLEFDYSYQRDHRDEFDVRRAGRSGIPALSLELESHQTSVVFKNGKHEHEGLKMGFQNKINFNRNDPATGILPLIPDYQSYWNGLYFIRSWEGSVWIYNTGIRADYGNIQVQYISRELPRSVKRNAHDFFTGAMSIGAEHTGGRSKTRIDMGLALRAPEVNELYSYGLHQGVASIEEGNQNLLSEVSWKSVLGNEWRLSEHLDLDLEAYTQLIQDYIFLRPSGMEVLTIRGAYPLYIYDQTNAMISGLDLQASLVITEHVQGEIAYSMVRGRDLDLNAFLINMPADRVIARLGYNSTSTSVETGWDAHLSYTFTARQTRTQNDLEIAPTPDSYGLVDIDLSYCKARKLKSITFILSGNNLLNTRYRDYLDRLRYFSDSTGRQLNAKILYKF